MGWGGGKGDGVDLHETIAKSCMIRFSKLLITNIDFCGNGVDLYETIMKSCELDFQNYWLQILIFSSTRGCSLEREMLTVNYLCE